MIEVENLNISYYHKKIIDNLSFTFDSGTLIGIIGPNGSGKSTMIKGILGLISIDRGNIYIDGESINKVRHRVAYLPQKNDLDWDFPINVLETVLMGTYPSLGLFKKPGANEKELAMKSLTEVDMDEYADRQIGELSGGQQQRVFLARALAQKADILFLDEPFTGIDVASEEKIVQILRNLKDKGSTIFVVNHDLSKTEEYFDNLILVGHNCAETGPVKDVFQYEKISAAYETSFVLPKTREIE